MTQRTLRSEAALRHRLLVAACLALLVMPLCAAAAIASVHPLASELLHYLGFKPGDRGAVLEKGGVLQSGLTAGEHFPEEVAAVGAMLLVNAADADAVIDASCMPTLSIEFIRSLVSKCWAPIPRTHLRPFVFRPRAKSNGSGAIR